MVELNECSSEECSLSESARSTTSSPHRFSIFKWFKRSPKQHTNTFGNKNPPETESSLFSSSESVDTFYSTTTVRSFAFHRGQVDGRRGGPHPSIDLSQIESGKVGPFGDGAVRIQDKYSTKLTTTLPANAISRRDNTITARYSLQSCSGKIGSCNNLSTTASNKRFVHVRGKRRAPNPPISPVRPRSLYCQQSASVKRIKRRPAPKPPIGMDSREKATGPSAAEKKIICSDTLILQGGLLLARHPNDRPRPLGVQTSSGATSMPRPWYKRNVFEYSTGCKSSASDAPPPSTSQNNHGLVDGSLRHFFSSKDKRKDVKRQSGLSILAKISELDKEAAAIVQEEQARSRVAMLLEASRLNEIEKRIDAGNEEVVQDIVTSAMNENSPKRGTKALISKFNAIGNVTRVTVNTSFFAKRPEIPEVPASTREKRKYLNKYFSPSQAGDNNPSTAFIINNNNNYNNDRNKQQTIIADVTNRLSILQDIVKKHSSNSNCTSLAESTSQNDENCKKSFSNSPKLVYSSRRSSSSSSNSSSRSNKVTAHPAPNTRTFGEKFDKVKTSAKLIQREIDSQLQETSKSEIEEENKNSTKVEKVLDILVEAEKDGQTKGRVHDSQDKVSDLKEILKEMKHSLPKRPKQKSSPTGQQSPEIVSNSKITQPPVLEIQIPPNKNTTPIEKQKVSFGVQTSGNIRKIQSSKGDATSKFIKKTTFHLMRPREFAAIEAIMTMKNQDQENTYANVIEQSIYANAIVLPSRNRQIIPIPVGIHKKKETTPVINSTTPVERMAHEMNTLAINRLMRKLEDAIASGNHQLAAGLAKELAKLKVRCSVVRQKVRAENLLNVDMFIEDRLAHQGPIPLQLPVNMTVGQLKDKIFNEFQIPVNVQRWIIGKKLADNNESTLNELNAIEGLPVFLYLAAPVLQINDNNKDEAAAGVAAEDNDIMEEEQENDDKLEIDINDELSDEDEIAPIVDVNLPNREDEEKQMTTEDEKMVLQVEKVGIIGKEELKTEEIVKNHNENDKDAKDNEDGAFGTTEEARMEYNELIILENCQLVPNVDAIECPICFVIYGPMEGVVLRDCLHTFCRRCLEDTIKYCTEAEIKCPYRDTQYTCESTLQEREIKALVEPQVYEQHLAKSISQAENNAGQNAFHCRTPNCPGWCIYDDNANNFLCPVCDMTNCLTCRVIHSGKNCWEYQEDVRLSKETDEEAKRTAAMLTEMMDRGEAMACPTCAVVLMKKWGCDWLRCSMCKTEICWVTRGPRWGPAGTGDTSGGCRCGLNGVKCHPQCNYCH